MKDILVAFLLVVLAPVCVITMVAGSCMFVYSIWSGKQANYAKLLKALAASTLVAIFFPIAFSLSVGWMLGPILGFGYAIVLLVFSAAAAIFSFIYFWHRGAQKWPTLKELRARYVKFVETKPLNGRADR